MKRLFLFTMMCLFGLFSLNAQSSNEVADTLVPVKWVNVTENAESVDVKWSMNFLDTEFEDFETGRFVARNWKNDSVYPWVITEDAYQSKFAMKSSCEKVDRATSSIEIEVNVPYDGFLAFNHRVSSEDNADYGNFYIDSVLQTTISGNREWRYAEVFVKAGTHTYKWEYTKDGSRHTYDDAYFVDNITFYKEIEKKTGWIGYDDGKWATSIGTNSESPTYWGVSFPVTAQYAGTKLTKISVYDAEKGGHATYTANIYLGGDNAPESLVSTQKFDLSGKNEFVEIALTTPVAIDGTKPLWITLYCDQSIYPIATSLKSEHTTADWLSTDGKEWKHAYEYKLHGSWMLRGYLENAEGRTRMLASEEDVLKYNVYRKNLYGEAEEVVLENTTATELSDDKWSTLEKGAYKWGVSVVYADDKISDTVWSNTLAKDMFTEVTVTAKTNSEDPIAGTVINFVNKVESEYSYSVILGLSDTHTFKNFRKGTYELSVKKEGYSSEYEGKVVEVWDAKEIECLLTEVIAPIENLYVSPTGWVMWDGANIGLGDEFSFDFEDGTLDGWTTIDADNDNYTWQNSIEIMAPGSGHNSSISCAVSMSWIYGVILTPDNYLVTANKYKIDETSKLRFWVCAQDIVAPNEHYGVAVSFSNNTDPKEFVTIWEETLKIDSNTDGMRGTAEQSQWYEKVVDLSEYAGQEIYIALRHFNCTDQYFLNIDDVSLESNVRNSRALESYQVYLDGKLVADNLNRPYYQHEDLVDGQEYTTTVVPVYATGKGAETSYTWKKVACDKFDGVKDLTAEYVNGVTTINWTMPKEAKSATRANNWLKYDNGEYKDGIGLAFPNDEGYIEKYEQIKWANMFPAADVAEYAGCPITKVSLFDNEAYEGEVSIYEGGNICPETLLHSQAYTATGAKEFIEVALTKAVNISGNKNVWIVLSNTNGGQQPAAGCVDQGNPNGRWLCHSSYEAYEAMGIGKDGWIDNQYIMAPPLRTWMIRACVETAEPAPEALGVMVFRNGKLIDKLVQGETFVDESANVNDEYSVRVVYGGEKDKSYYAMSCPQDIVAKVNCQAPKSMHAYTTMLGDGRFGTMLAYPYIPPTSEWLAYDEGGMMESIGGESLTTFYWGVKFPVEKLENYAGTSLTKVMLYDYVYPDYYDGVNELFVEIYYGGEDAPEILVHSEKYVGTGAGEYAEVELSYPLPVSGEENIWVILKTNTGNKFPATMARDCGDRNGRWVSIDGKIWGDIRDLDMEGTFMVRAFVTNERGVAKSIEPSTRELSFKNYNIYRGTSLDNVEVVGTTTEKTYFDEVEKGIYYYQVKAVYEEDGKECESEAAKTFNDEDIDYVVVEVTAIEENGVEGVMIYPNPTDGNLNINVEAMKHITIANTLGQIVYDQEVGGDNVIIDMAQHKAGVYMVRIVTDKGVAVKRFIKK